ncbi:hypothetical protein ADL12_03585 [Streptomyces regalis]|uniref:Beta-lactamase-related domain-containing protein n=1 Tax=Streptomyces regalis TaxID=68262 RepID=A0A0X3VLG0_9ACTN|nr:hypothetical protein ADL12_03585 [Streptomyces regalis]
MEVTEDNQAFTDRDGHRVDGTDWNLTFGGVGGALVSTPADLTRFASALLGRRLSHAANWISYDRPWPLTPTGCGPAPATGWA